MYSIKKMNELCRWAGQALFGTLTPDIIVLTLLYSLAGVFYFFPFSLLFVFMYFVL